ncbi:MAG: GH92 family glycosyl hydrolase [Bacteroidales bacterium]|nr:GH92 family glycosyl hydrolase [Bacteroidales bacterium]
MMKKFFFLLSIVALITFWACSNQENTASENQKEPADYVIPFIGTDGHGHTYPGTSLPFGMVQLSPDTRLEGWDGCSGYHYSDDVVYGFTHTHLSGTGVPDYGDILFMPTVGDIQLYNGYANPDSGYASRFSHENELAEAGFYAVNLDDYSINVELTTSKRVGFHKYIFQDSDRGNVILDLKHRDKVVDSWVKVINEYEIEGFRRSTGWAMDQRVYFVARFSQPFAWYGLALDDEAVDGDEMNGENIKAWFTFDLKDKKEVMIKVGISAVSVEGARKNMEVEIPDWNFEQIKADARSAWNEELGRIRVNGGSEAQLTTFYTALYHACLVPNLFQDVDGKYLGRDLEVHQANDFENYTVFSLWDTFRAEHPLFTIIDQKRTLDFIKTMLAQYQQGGRLPVWELAANETECMIGYHSIPVIVDVYFKGIDGFDAELALEAMVHSAELDHFGLKSYKENGFIPAEDEAESVSKTLEYAYDDWCIAMMAKAMGKTEIYDEFIKRAQSYKNIFDPSSGFMRARINGRWFEPFDPKEVNFNYTEANSWQYSFFVPQDISGLIKLMGSKELFIDHLDKLFTESSETTGREQSDITGLIGQYAHGNEPSHHMAYLYNYVGQPWKSQKYARQIMDELYTEKPDGLCGNEDCGQMSAWYVMSAMGIYPVTPGVAQYAIGSPLFEEVSINLENGKTFTIRTNNNSEENKYIQSARLNGKEYDKSFLMHSDIMNGGEIVFEMGPEPNEKWGVGEGNEPVSAITEHLITPVPFVRSGSRTFIDTTLLSLGSVSPEFKIHFTLDGTDPSKNSPVYSAPVILDHSVKLKAIAVDTEGNKSMPLVSEFFKIPIGRKITLNTAYANQYSAGGDLALIDFIRGPLNFKTGAWQGYEGVDIEAIVDLGSIQLISEIETGFLQDVGAWIFFPEEVRYFISNDGQNFQQAGVLKNKIPETTLGVNIQQYTLGLATKARYVKVIGKNRGICPDWHVGEGKPAWIFVDEIAIK